MNILHYSLISRAAHILSACSRLLDQANRMILREGLFIITMEEVLVFVPLLSVFWCSTRFNEGEVGKTHVVPERPWSWQWQGRFWEVTRPCRTCGSIAGEPPQSLLKHLLKSKTQLCGKRENKEDRGTKYISMVRWQQLLAQIHLHDKTEETRP
jgi:hypothetical protein